MNPLADNHQPETGKEHQAGIESFSQSLRLVIYSCYVIAVIMVIIIVAQSFLIVKDHEVGFIYQFGRLRAVVGTGLHLTWPYPIEESKVFQVTRSRQIETEAFLAKPTEGIPPVLKPGVDGYLFTGDRNIIHAKCTLTYNVNRNSDAAMLNYFTDSVNRDKELKLLLNNALIKAASSTKSDDLLWDINVFRSRVASIFRERITDSKIGIVFENKDISLETKAPAQAQSAFNALSQANQQVDTLQTAATTFKIKTVKAAKTQAEKIVADANSEFTRRVEAAKTAATYFTQLLEQFNRNPELVLRTIYEETMFRVFETVDEKFIVREDQKGQIRILLSKNLEKKKNDTNKK